MCAAEVWWSVWTVLAATLPALPLTPGGQEECFAEEHVPFAGRFFGAAGPRRGAPPGLGKRASVRRRTLRQRRARRVRLAGQGLLWQPATIPGLTDALDTAEPGQRRAGVGFIADDNIVQRGEADNAHDPLPALGDDVQASSTDTHVDSEDNRATDTDAATKVVLSATPRSTSSRTLNVGIEVLDATTPTSSFVSVAMGTDTSSAPPTAWTRPCMGMSLVFHRVRRIIQRGGNIAGVDVADKNLGAHCSTEQ